MNKDLDSYIKVYSNVLTKEECEHTVTQMSILPWQKHEFRDYSNTETFYNTAPDVLYGFAYPLDIMDKLWNVLESYHTDININWYDSWNGYSSPKYIRYNVGTEMKQHCDHIHSLFDGETTGVPVLTMIGVLNDDYEGGDLILCEDNKIKTQAGDVVVFPSNFLYPHTINQITKGARYSFASWVW